MSSNPSICIPRCDNIDEKKIKHIFSKFGCLKNIQIYNKKVIVRYKYWYNESANIIERLNSNQTVNIVYNFPWFWKCFKYFPNYIK